MDKKLSTEQTMTVKEVAGILGVTPEAIKKHVRKHFPNSIRNGKQTLLAEWQVVEIKRNMVPTTQVVANKTEIERKKVVLEAMQILSQEIDLLKSENEMLKPKARLADDALRDTSKHYCIRDAGKHIGLSQTAIFDILRSKGLLTKKRLPTQKAIDAGILTLRTNSVNGKNRPQSVMTMENILTFKEKYKGE